MESTTFKFFVSCIPGFESILADEVQQYINNEAYKLEMLKGGIEISLPLELGFTLNQTIKTASRVLIRIDEFKCKDIPKLYQKISKINWAKWLLGPTTIIKSESHQSRLFDDRKINQAVIDGIELFFNSNPRKKKYIELYEKHSPTPQIYIRFNNDLCTISLDTTGELLHLRGEKELQGLAPIRENMAYALLRFLISKSNDKSIRLIDPMCGSGTFLLEAYRFQHTNSQRSFNFNFCPSYIELKFNKEINLNIINPFNEIIGFDINQDIVDLAKKNLANTNVKIFQKSTFESNKIISNLSTFVIVNPPYGKRVKSEDETINLAFFKSIILNCFNNFQFKYIGIIIPSDYQLKSFDHFNVIDQLKFRNGGIPVVFYILESK